MTDDLGDAWGRDVNIEALRYGTRRMVAHYTRADVAFGAILGERRAPSDEQRATLRFSSLTKTRDPLESMAWQPFFLGKHMRPEDRDRVQARFDEWAPRLTPSLKVLSTTKDLEDPVQRCWSHPRLWEQYADNHQGACLLLDHDVLADRLADHAAAKRVWHRHGEVRYGPLLHRVHPGIMQGLRWDEPLLEILHRSVTFEEAVAGMLKTPVWDGNPDRDGATDVADWVLYRKMPDWASEAEYRYSVVHAEGDYVDLDVSGAVFAVVLGHAFQEWHVPGAVAACRRNVVTLYRGKWRPAGLAPTEPACYAPADV